MNELKSPCNGICQLDQKRQWCSGCGRTAFEIARWPYADDLEKSAILDGLPARLKLLQRSPRPR